jgi:polyphenol oxidase
VSSVSAPAPLSFALPGGGHALFTARAGGNLSTLRGPGHERGREQRERLCAELDLHWLCASRQIHGVAVQRVTERCGRGGEPVAIDADGHATALRGVGVMVLVADCLPVVIGCEGAVVALHAGWRGLAAGVLEEGVRALRELGGEGEALAIIGPGARACCYEVGEEVRAALDGGADGGRPRGEAPRPGPREGARRNIDLATHARTRLEAAGLEWVEDVGACTICDERFFSHRREGLDAGRQAGMAWLS